MILYINIILNFLNSESLLSFLKGDEIPLYYSFISSVKFDVIFLSDISSIRPKISDFDTYIYYIHAHTNVTPSILWYSTYSREIRHIPARHISRMGRSPGSETSL